MRRLVIGLLSCSVLIALSLAPQAGAAPRGAAAPTHQIKFRARQVTSATSTTKAPNRPFGQAGRDLLSRGYLVGDRAAYAAAKARAERGGASTRPVTPPRSPLAPSSFRSWTGIKDPNVTPPDTTGAVGNTRYVEMVNDQFGIYNRTSNTPLDSGPFFSLTGDPSGFLTDPQIMWDGQTKRFYYLVLNFDVITSPDDGIDFDFGWSKTASPNTAADWCKYFFSFGYDNAELIPDYPKMGDTKNFVLIGVNAFTTAEVPLGADALWLGKPAAGTTCPAGSTIPGGGLTGLKNSNGTRAGTLVPATQNDTDATGWIVAAQNPTGGAKTIVTLFKITKNANGTANIPGTGTSVTVPSYSLPPGVTQNGTTKKLDSLDGRLTQAQSAIDPSHGTVAIWTQHTVANSTRTKVDWYEIDPVNKVLFQNGTASSASLFVFNGAIAPDRLVKGTTTAFGDSMVLNFNTASSTAFPAIQMVSKIGAGAQSAFVLLKQSPGKNQDFSCDQSTEPTCRWGDYAAATPDPGADPLGAHGQVWGTNEWNVASTTAANADWRTQNFGLTP